MKELIIHDNEAGQRLDKLLRKYLSEAPGSFIEWKESNRERTSEKRRQRETVSGR